MSNEQTTQQQAAMANIGYQAAGALQIRLNTEPILQQIQMFLAGKYVVLATDKDGLPMEKTINVGKPMANELGIQRIMSYLQGIFNPQVVQGNFDTEMYADYLASHRKALAIDIVLNMHRYKIKVDDINGLMDRIFSMVEPFISRTLKNLERESYAQTIKTSESNTQTTGGNKLSFMGG